MTGPCSKYMCNFKRNSWTFPYWLYHFGFQWYMRVLFSPHPDQPWAISFCLSFSLFSRCVVILMILLYIPPITNDVEHLFMCSFVIHIYSLVKFLFKSLAYFCWIVILLFVRIFKIYSPYKPFIRYVFSKYILSICSLVLHFYL